MKISNAETYFAKTRMSGILQIIHPLSFSVCLKCHFQKSRAFKPFTISVWTLIDVISMNYLIFSTLYIEFKIPSAQLNRTFERASYSIPGFRPSSVLAKPRRYSSGFLRCVTAQERQKHYWHNIYACNNECPTVKVEKSIKNYRGC